MLLTDVSVRGEWDLNRGIVQDHALARAHCGVEHGLDEFGGRHRLVPQRHLNLTAASRRLRGYPRLVAREKNEQASLGSRMLERDSHERLDDLAELDLARHRLRSLDHCPDI